VLHLEPYPHHCGPLDVVSLGEGRPPTVRTDVPDNGLDSVMIMVPIRGGRAVPPVKVTISIDLAAGASVLVWAAAAVGARPRCVPSPEASSTCPCMSRLPPPCPWGCVAARCATCSRADSFARLSSSSLPPSAETELLVLLLLPLLLPVPPSPALPPLPSSLQSLPPLAHVPLSWQPRPPVSDARSRRPSAKTVLQTWHASGGLLHGKEVASDELLLICAGEEG
jgi:hypothetical protein